MPGKVMRVVEPRSPLYQASLPVPMSYRSSAKRHSPASDCTPARGATGAVGAPKAEGAWAADCAAAAPVSARNFRRESRTDLCITSLVVRMVGNQLPAILPARLRMRDDVGIAVNAQYLRAAALTSSASAFERNHLIRADVVEVEHVVRLALEEERARAVRLQLEAIPEEGALAVAVPVAAHEVRVAVQRMRRPLLQQVSQIVEPVELRGETAVRDDLVGIGSLAP